MRRTFIDYILISLKGIAMGAADVVPGVSGGTIAFISGIYEELISSISKINLQALKVLTQEGIVAFWKYINGSFFVALLSGIGISILSLAKIMKFLLENHPIMVWSFFFGLMVASVLFLMKEIERWNFGSIMVMLLAGAIAYIITVIPPLVNGSNENVFFIFLCGALAICAMILPGISGAFILVLLGAYHTVLDALSSWNFKIILIFGMGALTGILSFSKALKWLFAKYRNLTFAGLTGFIIGSLNKVWPWKETLQTDPLNGSVIHEKSVLPSTFEMITHNDAQVVTALLLAIVGFFVIYGIEKWSNLQKS
ncbi:DUF368 domain-containing protein [Capnocytophaga sp. Marseille-Q4570]|uniref:DUF368 domain-containing protein n=1 Tax=Capnocytophaga bilenii TaxID=2819369 RepID=A0ABS3PYG9_9FLAO|nr:DUF368 domain-containing protein [Capnocytophaga bilenii]MBO1884385.1 DUF368 domain-containing protein [Capnocytophaga bilenii]